MIYGIVITHVLAQNQGQELDSNNEFKRFDARIKGPTGHEIIVLYNCEKLYSYLCNNEG